MINNIATFQERFILPLLLIVWSVWSFLMIIKTFDMEKHIVESIETYVDLFYTPKINELKSLQKKIDEAEDKKNLINQNSWGRKMEINETQEYMWLIKLIESNQSKIKQIIEEL